METLVFLLALTAGQSSSIGGRKKCRFNLLYEKKRSPWESEKTANPARLTLLELQRPIKDGTTALIRPCGDNIADSYEERKTILTIHNESRLDSDAELKTWKR